MEKKLTPMMQQYHELRRDLPPGTLLLFRLGDFYELFFEDAIEAASLLKLALTKRGETPMCGVPFHAARRYITRILRAGKKAAICEQVGEVKSGKLVEREITQIITPATLDEAGLEDGENNFMAALFPQQQKKGEKKGAYLFGLAYIDLSTGEFLVTEVEGEESLLDEISRMAPPEILVPSSFLEEFGHLKEQLPLLEELDKSLFTEERASDRLCRHFGVQSLDGFGAEEFPSGVVAAGCLLLYLTLHLRRDVSHITDLQPYRHQQYLLLDAATQSHLELVYSSAGREHSLLGVLDRTKTPMGARTLRYWVLHPLLELEAIEARQKAVGVMLQDSLLLHLLREQLSLVRDLERAVSRLSQNSGNARDLAIVGETLHALPKLKELLLARGNQSRLLQQLEGELFSLEELADLLGRAIVEGPPPSIKEGGMIRTGFHPELDELHMASKEGKRWIAAFQEEEIKRIGIKSLKVKFNAVFGYFIEVTKSNLGLVPPHYVRKQTTANGERYITDELKKIEEKILGAEERSRILEQTIFEELRQELLKYLNPLQKTARSTATLDALGSLAETARLYQYQLPKIKEGTLLEIVGGRHPVLEQHLKNGSFVPNDTRLDAAQERLAIITGPNMAGKSTYLRQVALLTIMAQMGSYLPVEKATIGLVDRLFTRVGAHDNLSRGQSTFMVEMHETSRILHHATERSLLLLDEIGRGTATFDGLSLAWSVAEYLHDVIGARTIFATHYHELPDLAKSRLGVINLNVAVQEKEDEIIFLHKILPGAADRSYGIQVARLAGIPAPILERAKEILTNLERSELQTESRSPKIAAAPPMKESHSTSKKKALEGQRSLFEGNNFY